MYQFDFLRDQEPFTIINKIAPYKYVSFDIFDTLLKRDVLTPIDVFKLVGKVFNDNDFVTKRIHVEKVLRQSSNTEEITLDQIYDSLGSSYILYKEEEIKIEQNLLCKNPIIAPVYEYCKKQGKKIVITSDMYLPETVLRDILHKNDISFDFCFISNTHGVKKVTGNLFRKVLNDLDILPNDIIHIGDSVRADFLGARKVGITSVLIPKLVNNTSWLDVKNKKQQTVFNIFINNHLNLHSDQYYQFGYAYFGPLLYGFTRWLHQSTGHKKIFFFARDGYIVKQAYDAMYPSSDTDYIYLSRRALSVPLLWKHSRWDEFSKYITITRFFTLGTLLDRLGLNPNQYEVKASEFGLNLSDNFNKNDFLQNSKLKAFYQSISADVINNSRKEFDFLTEYFNHKNFSGDIAIVDIGWNGSMQRYLLEIMDLLNINVRIEGYYFGMRNYINNTIVRGYLYNPEQLNLEPTISFMQGLFESLFLSNEGSTKCYGRINGIVKPILYDPEYNEEDIEYQSFASIQKGAQDFCEMYINSYASLFEEYSHKEYSYSLLKFGTQPSFNDVDLFGDFRFFDTNVVFFSKPKSLLSYIRCPKSFFKDFSYSVWKAGFIKKSLKIVSPYASLYKFLKRRTIKG